MQNIYRSVYIIQKHVFPALQDVCRKVAKPTGYARVILNLTESRSRVCTMQQNLSFNVQLARTETAAVVYSLANNVAKEANSLQCGSPTVNVCQTTRLALHTYISAARDDAETKQKESEVLASVCVYASRG